VDKSNLQPVNKVNNNKEDSLKKRYFFKLGANLIVLPISIVIQSIIPRGLGPSAYGDFTFLTNFFAKVTGFFDAGTSIAFYTKVSQRQNDKGLIKFYWHFILFISLLIFLVIPLIFLFNKQEFLWPGQSKKYIWMALIFSLLAWDSQIINKIVDAYGYTTNGEIIRVSQKILALLLIILLFINNKLNLTSFFIYSYIILIVLSLGWWFILKKNGVSLFPKVKLKIFQWKGYLKEFYHYSHPLITYSFVRLLVGILDVWLLQKFAGSVQQGFYGLSYKIASICFLFASAMTPIITREFSIAYSKNDIQEMRRLFIRYIPMIYAVVAFFAVFLSINAQKVSFIFGGEKFKESALAITIMSLYPIHQTYGQLSGSVFYATGQTKIYRNIGVSLMLIGFPITFFLLAPKNLFGFNLGSVGLVLKMVVLQFIGVNIQLWFNAKYLKFSFIKLFSHQLYTIVTFAAVSYISFLVGDYLSNGLIVSFFISGLLYTIFSIVLIYSLPILIFSSRREIKQYISIVLNKCLYIIIKNRNPK